MNSKPVSSAHEKIIEEYFRTTSAAGSATTKEGFESSVLGLRRRLARWCDVAGKDVIDLGAGTGEFCCLAKRAGAQSVVGVNLSQDEIDFALQRVDAQFVRQDVAAYLGQCAAGTVDRIFALNILEHLDKDTLVNVLENAFRVLRPGGQFVGIVPNATSPFGGMTRYWDITHQTAFTPSSVRQLARLIGYGEVEFRECSPVPHGLVSGFRFALWQLVRLAIFGYLMIESASNKGGIYTADMMFRFAKTGGDT